jgi:AcrR family transcriptional regulator
MTSGRKMATATKHRGEPVRQRVLDAAERLLRDGKAEFSMRELASEAGVSFATPFNQFGNKPAIMHALSARRIEAMMTRFSETPSPPHAADRVALALGIAVAVMLEEPIVNRAVMAWIGTGSAASGEVRSNSTALWAHALGDGVGLLPLRRDEACRLLPAQLALAFRGALSFWTAGDLADEELGPAARQIADTLLRAYSSD